MGPEKLLVEQLEGENNYYLWKVKMESILKSKAQWTYVTDGLEEDEKDAKTIGKAEKAFATILLHVTETLLFDVHATGNAKAAWKLLKDRFEGSGKANRLHLHRSLYRSKMNVGERMADYICRVRVIAGRLAAAGKTIGNEDIMYVIFAGLPEDYENVMLSLESVSPPLSGLTLCTRLLEEEARKK